MGTVLITSRSRKSSFEGSKSCPGTSPICAIRATIGASAAVGGLALHQFREALEIGDRVHRVHLLAHRGLHVELRIDDAGRRRVRLAVGGERHDRELVL